MILQALKEYYDRKAADPESGIAMWGWFSGYIDYAIVLDLDGNFSALQPLFSVKDRKTIRKPCLLPYIGKQARKHIMSGTDANLLWDNATFVLGLGNGGCKKLNSFIEAIRLNMVGVDDPAIDAVVQFLENGQRDQKVFNPILKDSSCGEDIRKGRPTITFRINADPNPFIFDRPLIKARISTGLARSELLGTCLVSGASGMPIEENHVVIKNLYGATKDPNLLSFNDDAYRSYGKQKGDNAPVGMQAAFAYTTALNHLARPSGSKIKLGDATLVYWSEKSSECSTEIKNFFGCSTHDDPDKFGAAVEALYKSVQTGAFTVEDTTARFFVLGMTAFGPRIAIRSWVVETIKNMSHKICSHFDDTHIVQPLQNAVSEPQWLSLNALLAATAIQVKGYDPSKPHLVRYNSKYYDVKPNLEADMLRAILEGLLYPQTLLQGALCRIRAEQKVTYARAAIIKAYLNRLYRLSQITNTEELKVSLDPSNRNIGYRLGRLFAVLEKIQIDANHGRKLNATIRKRYYGAASSTPLAVFGTLLNRLNPHHMEKLKGGVRVERDKALCEILEGVDGAMAFPASLSLEDQGRFAIGYYHQVRENFSKNANNA